MFGNITNVSFTILVVGPSTLVLYYIFTRLVLASRRRQLALQHGCKEPRSAGGLLYKLLNWPREMRTFADGTLLDELQDEHRRFGSTYKTASILGPSDAYLTTDPENIKTILSTNFQDFNVEWRHYLNNSVFGDGIITTDGEKWHRSRASLRPSFNRSDISDVPLFEKHVATLISVLPKDGTTVDLREYFYLLTADASTEFLLGYSANRLDPTKKGTKPYEFYCAYERLLDNLTNQFRHGLIKGLLPNKQRTDDRNHVFKFLDDAAAEAIARQRATTDKSAISGHRVLLDSLAAQMPDNPKQIRDEFLNVLTAGRDTTASLLTNLWHTISQRSDIQDKLRAEIASLDGASPTFEQLKDLRYLQWTLNESMRVHPVVPLNERWASRDVILPTGGGPDCKAPILMKKGDVCMWNIWTMHRREDVYGPDAAEFRPERWETLRPGWAFLPFHGGPRVCMGQQLALTEAAYTTVRLLQTFSSIESRDPEPWKCRMDVTTSSRNGAKVAFRP